MWISTIIGSSIFRIPRDTVLGLAFSIAPEKHMVLYSITWIGSTCTNGIHFLYDSK